MTLQASSCQVPLRGFRVSGIVAPLIGSALLAGLIAGGTCLAEPVPRVVKDIKVAPPSANGTQSLYQVGDKMFFFAEDATHGSELWVSDGTVEGTRMVKDLISGNGMSGLRMLGQAQGLLLFTLNERGLWRSDGTAEGTFMISEALAAESHMSQGLFWFEAEADPGSGIVTGPWRSDGTAEGTYALPLPAAAAPVLSPASSVIIIQPPGAEILPGDRITTIGQSVFFTGANHRILAYDTTSGTTQDLGIHLPSLDFQGGGNWASALTGSSNSKMEWHAFKGDGSGFVNLAPDQNWSSARHAGSLGNIHLAVVRAASDQRWSLWRSDGTPAGTRMLKQLPDSERSPVPSAFTRAGDKIFFVTDDSRTGSEPWVTDGTPEGTMLLREIRKGSYGSAVFAFQASGDSVYFGASDGRRSGIWKSNGTPKGTAMLKGLPKNLNVSGLMSGERPALLDGNVYFPANRIYSASTGPSLLWRSDGTGAGTRALMPEEDGDDARPNDDKPEYRIHAAGDSVVFRAWDKKAGVLWKSDGTEAGTFPLESEPVIKKRRGSEWGARNLCNLDERILFVNMENSKKQRRTLYVSDGTANSARLVQGIPAKAYPTGITNMVRSGEWVYMHTEQHLWATRGDAADTFKLLDIATLDQKIVAETMVASAGNLYFSTGSLWKANAGTRVVGKIIDGSTLSFYPNNLTVAGDFLYFSGWANGFFQLWKSDGTPQGTALVKSLGSTGELKDFAAAGGLLWFTFKPLGEALQLWCSDGTFAGTKAAASIPVEFGMAAEGPGGRLFFRAWDRTNGNELWSSNGTAAGTSLVKDINPGGGSSMVTGITRVGEQIYFAATHPVHGRELWKSDGTTEGTVLVADLTADGGSSSPLHLVLAGSQLFFDATTEETGREVHVLDVSADLAE